MKKYIVSFVTFITLFYGGQLAFAQNLTDGDPSNDVCINLQTQVFRYRSSDTTTNGEVSVLQDFLIDKGMLSGQATGFYGRATVAAVKNYQRQVGINPTGNVGALTKSYIMKETCSDGTVVNQNNTYVPPKINNTVNNTVNNPVVNYIKYESGSFVVYGSNFKVSNDSNYYIAYKANCAVAGSPNCSGSLVSSNTNESGKLSFPLNFQLLNSVTSGEVDVQLYEKVGGSVSPRFTVNISAAYSPVSDKSFSLLAPRDIERNNIITTVNSGGYVNVLWKSGSGNVDQLMNFSILSLNSAKGDGAYQLGTAYLSQKSFVFSVPKNLKTDDYIVIASNSDNTLYSNSPSFRVVNTAPDPVIDSFSVNNAQEFSLSARNYSSISFKADCGNGVAITLSPSRTSASYPQGSLSLCNEYQFYQKQGVDTGYYPSINNQYVSLWSNDTLDGSVTYVGSPQNMNTGGNYTLKVRVCNIANKCVEAQAPGRFYAKG